MHDFFVIITHTGTRSPGLFQCAGKENTYAARLDTFLQVIPTVAIDFIGWVTAIAIPATLGILLTLPARGQSARGKVISKREDSALTSELIHQREIELYVEPRLRLMGNKKKYILLCAGEIVKRSTNSPEEFIAFAL